MCRYGLVALLPLWPSFEQKTHAEVAQKSWGFNAVGVAARVQFNSRRLQAMARDTRRDWSSHGIPQEFLLARSKFNNLWHNNKVVAVSRKATYQVPILLLLFSLPSNSIMFLRFPICSSEFNLFQPEFAEDYLWQLPSSPRQGQIYRRCANIGCHMYKVHPNICCPFTCWHFYIHMLVCIMWICMSIFIYIYI